MHLRNGGQEASVRNCIYIVSQRRNIILSVRDILRITVTLQMSRFELLVRDESRC